MSKKPNIAASLTAILSAKRGDNGTAAPALSVAVTEEPETVPPPSPALPSAPPRVETAREEAARAATQTLKGRGGKSSDPNYSQFSVYLPKKVRKKVGRALDDDDNGQDFSELVEELLVKWLASRT